MPRSASTLAVRVGDKIGALKGLAMRLREISQYLSQVVAGKLPMNQAASGAGSTRTSMSVCVDGGLLPGNHLPIARDLQSDA